MAARNRDTTLVSLDERRLAHESLTAALLAFIRELLGSQPDSVFWGPEWNTVSREMYMQVREAQEQAAQVTWDTTAALLRDLDLKPPKRRPDLGTELRGVPISELWDRPAEQYRVATLLGSLDDESDAVDAAVRRASSLAVDDVRLAERVTERDAYEATDKVVGYRRILHPEESQGGSCGLCVAAATRVYTRAELLPVHGGCNCTTAPVTAEHDPGLTANAAFLKRLYGEAGGTSAKLLAKTRYKVIEHGELGPQLVDLDHKHRSADELARRREEKATTVYSQRQIDAEVAKVDRVIANVMASSAPDDRKARKIAQLERRRLYWSKQTASSGPTFKYGTPEWVAWQRADAVEKLDREVRAGDDAAAERWRKYIANLDRRSAA